MKALSVKALCAAMLFGSATVSAEWVVGGGIGIADSAATVSSLNDELAATGFNATVTTSDDKRDTLQFFADYRSESWGARLAYVNLGNINATINGTVLDVNAFVDAVSGIHPLSARGWEMDAMYRLPLGEGATLLARAGLYRWRSEYDIGNGTINRTVSSNGTDTTYGLTIEVPLGLEFRGYAEWSRYLIVDDSVDVFGMGVGFAF